MMYFLFSFWGLVFWPTIFVFTFGMYRHWFCIYNIYSLWTVFVVCVYGLVFMAMCMDMCLWIVFMAMCMDIGY